MAQGRVSRNTCSIVIAVLATSCQFHPVQENVLYRSGQLEADQLQQVIDRKGVRTIVNLRGAQPGKKWWDEEAAMAQANGVELWDIRMGAYRLPHREDLLKLIEVFETAPQPMLVHCQGGADRTGEAVAMFAMDFWGWSALEASKKHLNSFFSHFRGLTPAKSYFIEKVYQGKEWAKASYFPCSADYLYYDKSHCPKGGKEDLE